MIDNEALLVELIEIFHTTINDIKITSVNNENIPEYYLIITASALIGKILNDKEKHNTLRILNNYTVLQINEIRKNNLKNSASLKNTFKETTVEDMIQKRSEYVQDIVRIQNNNECNLLVKLCGHGDYYNSDYSKFNHKILNIISTVESKISDVQFD